MSGFARRSGLLAILLAVGILWYPVSGRAADCSPTTFVQARTYFAGQSPQSVVLGHFDADGVLDAAVANGTYEQNVSVLLGDGTGGFGPPISTSVGSYTPELLAAGDFNNDGKLDLAVADVFNITILLGNGDGTFQPPQGSFRAATAPSGIAVGDFDGDGKLDIVQVSQSDGPLVFFGSGNGSFGSAISIDSTIQGVALAVADLDGDGRSDLVVSLGNSSTLRVYLGQADRSFIQAPDLAVETPVGPLAIGDFNNDGKSDIAVIANGYAAILLGNGDGTFQAALESPLALTAIALAAADIDLDGKLDLVVTTGDSAGDVLVLLGNGQGLMALDGGYQTGPYGFSTCVADLNGDGRPDVVAANAGATSISVLLSQEGARFSGIEAVRTLPYAGNFASGDFNGDGTPDLVAVGFLPNGSNEGAVQALLGDGRGGFRAAPAADAGYGAAWVAAGDFDEDGRLDVAVVSHYQNVVGILLGNGDGTFRPPTFENVTNNGMAVAVADLDGDGHLDLVLAEGISYGSGSIATLLGNGDGTFRPSFELALPGLPAGLFVADVNGDGHPDVVISNQTLIPGQDSISVFLGNGDGTLAPPASFLTGPSPLGIGGGDFNGDGKVDLVVADGGASNVSLLAGDGNGGFGPPTLIAVGAAPVFVAAGDFNGDGKLDFATSNGAANDISVLLGVGSGAFQSPVIYPTGANPQFVLADDLTGAGTIDLVVENANSSTASVLLNSRLSSFIASRSVLVGSSAVLAASGTGYGPLAHQWRKSGTPIPGATGPTLTIDPATFGDAGSYDVLVTDSCTSVASTPGVLSVEFADVPTTNIFHADIITIATAGITAGCGGANYCPTALVTRAQMSVFLLKSEHGSSYVPPDCTGLFADVACPSPFADWIERLASEGVTAGCGGNDYCPDNSVTRAQMAVFLLKTNLGSGYVPPPAVGIFGDVPVGSFAADWIEDLYNRGIAGGCSASPLLYCPGSPVNRAQMAAFLVRTFF